MSWISEFGLRNRIATSSVPLVLCGPVLRHVAPDSVSVFVALKHPREITLHVLKVLEGSLPPAVRVMEGKAQTARLGEFLHVALVTASATSGSPGPLQGGLLYTYDMIFEKKGDADPGDDLPAVRSLVDLGLLSGSHPLGYREGSLPGFALPPDDLNDLRIIHGSCRKPHGESLDALEGLDMMIESTRSHPLGRPHQLFLTGDQIYSDDVADALLLMLLEAGETLLGWQEFEFQYAGGSFKKGYQVVPKGLDGVSIPVEQLLPAHRETAIRDRCGFTACPPKDKKCKVDRSHLMTLGEYCAMYLFAWSEALWPAQLPDFADVYPGYSAFKKMVGQEGEEVPFHTPLHLQYLHQRGRVEHYRNSLDRVRRALANVPVYMMMDDHEITDDWFINRTWCERVLNKPLGRRVIQNGLGAFAVFQAWGNDPQRFAPSRPGQGLLEALSTWSASEGTDGTARTRLNNLVNVPDDFLASIQNNRRLTHQPGGMDWHYRVIGPRHEVLVLDTRTWRAYPGAPHDFPVLLSSDGFSRQLGGPGPGTAEVTLVVSPVPVVGVPFVELHQKKAKSATDRLSKDTEAWAFQPSAYETLFSLLGQRLPLDGNGVRRGVVVLLSGDVHYGYAARLQYWAEKPFAAGKPFDTPQRTEVEMIAAQFVASSFKNETGGLKGTRQLHTKGFGPTVFDTAEGDKLPIPPEVVGWNNQGGSLRTVGTVKPLSGMPRPWAVGRNPAIEELHILAGYGFTPRVDTFADPNNRPHWRYRIDFILADNDVTDPARSIPRGFSPRFVPVPPPGAKTGEQRKKALAAYLAMSANYKDYARQWGDGKEVVGVNNIGEISFHWSDDDSRAVVQEIWWRMKKFGGPANLLPPFPLSKAVISLNFVDSRYPQPIV